MRRASFLHTFCVGVRLIGMTLTHFRKNGSNTSKFRDAQGKLGTPVFSADSHTSKRLSTRTCLRMGSIASHSLASPSILTRGMEPCFRFRPMRPHVDLRPRHQNGLGKKKLQAWQPNTWFTVVATTDFSTTDSLRSQRPVFS